MSESAQGAVRARSGCLHLPVAPRANFRRRFGEASLPGRALGVGDVAQWVDRVLADGVTLTGAGVSGPGEPLAEPAITVETLRSVHENHPELPLFLITSGLFPQGQDIAAIAKNLAAAGLSRVTILVDAVDPAIVEQIFAWIRPGRRTLPLPEAARYFVDAQAQAIKSFREAGVVVVTRMTVYPGVNDAHVEEVANVSSALGADMFDLRLYAPQAAPTACGARSSSCSPAACFSCGLSSECAPVAAPGPMDEDVPTLTELAPGRMDELKASAAHFLRLVTEQNPCDEDIRWMEQSTTPEAAKLGVPMLPQPSGGRVNVAVASSGGLDVDMHLGQAGRFLIYGPRAEDNLACLLGTREAPAPGGGDQRWIELSQTLRDCFALLVASAGARPREILAKRGISVLTTESSVQDSVDVLFGGGKRPGKRRVKVD